ncbi:MAG: 50S ribosomal protein L13 [Candidatus Nanoarchaeia archaeon]
MIIIDATNLILGRMAARVAKLALSGEEVIVVNCEKAIISGKKSVVLAKFKQREARVQPFKGPFRKRMPDRIVRSAIRGMLPHGRWSEESRGRLALRRIKCFIGIPDKYKTQKIETFTDISVDKLKTEFYTTVGEIAQLLRQKA